MNSKQLDSVMDEVLKKHTAVLGMTGSGKTSTSKLLVERVVAQGARVCVLDPIKMDWWGMISSASGKKPGLPFHILGGPHGHVPLHSSAGAAIGELVATGALPLSIIDMIDFEAGGLQRFFVDFSETLIKKMRGVLYLVIEEAHEFAPKERAGIGNENMSIHFAKKLATAGRSRGIRLIVATQRTQSLHNALLGSCPTMIVHQLTAPADQEPVLKFLKANVKKEQREPIEGSLSSLAVGEGWICSSAGGIIERVKFPRITTFDNSATPEDDSHSLEVVSSKVDRDKLRSIIGDAVKEAEANDPATLKAEIARLQKASAHLADPKRIAEWFKASPRPPATTAFTAGPERQLAYLLEQAEASGATDPKEIQEAEQNGFTHGRAVGRASGYVDGYNACRQDVIDGVPTVLEHCPDEYQKLSAPTALPKAAPARPAPTPKAAPVNKHQTSEPRPAAASGDLTPSLQKVLDAIAWWRHIGVEPVRRERASVVAGYSPKASTFGVYIADLVKRGYIETAPGTVQLTDEGLALANAPTATSREELRDMARALLDPQPARVFDAIYDAYPASIRRDDVAESVGLSPKASTCGVYIAAVAAYGIIEADGRGSVRAADWLFP